MRIIDIDDEKDANLVISLAKRLKGKIMDEPKPLIQSKKIKTIQSPAPLEVVSKRSRSRSIPEPSDWQRTERQYWEL